MKITEFQNQYRFLSNFYPAMVEFGDVMYPSVEHAYQAAKFDSLEEKMYIANLKTAREAKAAGKGVKPKGWRKHSLMVMEALVRLKFQNNDLKQMLLDTGDVDIIEGNWWGDTFWGECPLGVGDNHLGRILMKVREELKYESGPLFANAG